MNWNARSRSSESAQGIILGTAAYMSPEQARGKLVDKKTDIWAFGCILYEMLTAQPVFRGEDVSEILASVIKGGVMLGMLPEGTNVRIREVLARCFQKDLKKRYQDVGDLRYDLEQVRAGSGIQSSITDEPAGRQGVPLLWLAVTVAVGVIAALAVWNLKPESPRQTAVGRFVYTLPEDQAFSREGRRFIALSPDGTKIVYVANEQLFLRHLKELAARSIKGSAEDPMNPFFSPDGNWIGYFAVKDKKLKKISIAGGAPVPLCDVGFPYSASWSSDDTIVVANNTGILSVPASGGVAKSLIKASGGSRFYGPQILPGKEWVLFTHAPSGTTNWDESQAVIYSLKSGKQQVIWKGGSNFRYVSTRHLLFTVGDVLFAVPFDAEKMQTIGGQLPAVEGVRRASSSSPTGAADYDFSDDGTLVYVAAVNRQSSLRKLIWVDRNGNEKPLAAEPKDYQNVRISPDSTRVALTIADSEGKSSIWIWNSSENMSRLTLDDNSSFPVWSPDNRKIAFISFDEDKTFHMKWRNSDDTGDIVRLFSASKTILCPAFWLPDGKSLVIASTSGSNLHIYAISTEPESKPMPLLHENAYEAYPQISPDGKWMAYMSSDDGKRYEVYVRPFPDVKTGKTPISSGGGMFPLWSPDGSELFYLRPDGSAMAAAVIKRNPTFDVEKPRSISKNPYTISPNLSEGYPWDINLKTGQFLVLRESSGGRPGSKAPEQINIVLNWFEELKQRVPLK